MKNLVFTFFLFFNSLFAAGQILNPDFELQRDTSKTLPQSWHIDKVQGYTICLDNQEKQSGQFSLKISGDSSVSPNSSISFSQLVSYGAPKLKIIAVTGYIRTQEIKSDVQLWCQILNKDNKPISFQNLKMQGLSIQGTNHWKKYRLTMILGDEGQKLLLGGYLQGSGKAWFDHFVVEEISNSGQPTSALVKNYIRRFTGIIKKNSLFSDSINWPIVKSQLKILSKGLTTYEDAHILLNYMIDQLRKAGDKHSFLQQKIIAENYAKGNAEFKEPKANLIGNNLGYVFVPGFLSINDTTSVNFTTRIQELIQKLDTTTDIKGWIIDLRENAGGNMYPMIAGLGPVLQDGTLGYFVTKKHSRERKIRWFYKDGSSGENHVNEVTVKHPYALKNPNVKVAVLIGAGSASSGELTAISFIGKPNTKLFGQQTGGYTTGNKGYKLPDGAYLYLANSYDADRTGKKYSGKIQPDIIVQPIAGQSDAVLQTAIEWIK